jgi:sugar lactone lactonase YvrE
MSVKWLAPILILLLVVGLTVPIAAEVGGNHILITNDDVISPFPGLVSLYTIGADGSLTLMHRLATGGFGIGGGFFGLNRIAVMDDAAGECFYISEANTGDIVSIEANTTGVTGHIRGSATDTGAGNGIGLATNSHFLYANFTDTSTIGTFQLLPGCQLQFVGDTVVSGMQNGTLDAMAVNGKVLVATYGDGSIESFDISKGTPVSRGDKQNSTAFDGGTYPNGIDITRDGRFAIFGDTATSTVVEVSDLSSGKLSPTAVYRLGKFISSSNIMLSPDETILYIANTQNATVSAAFFDKATGTISPGCTSGYLRNYVSGWSYLAGMALQERTGNGGGVYVAEFGAPSAIAIMNLSVDRGKCTLTEAPGSPMFDRVSPGLLSIASYPPRSF